MEGAILISRSLIDSEVFASEKLLKIWIWLLIKANFTKRSVPVKIGQGQSVINLERGQLLFGRLSAENDLFIDGSTIYKCIKRFEALEMITIKSNSHYSVITICNYDKYQDLNNYKVATKQQPRNKQVTTVEQLRNTDNKDNKENNILTSGGWDKNKDHYDKIVKFFPKLFSLKQPLKNAEHQALIEKYGEKIVLEVYGAMQNDKKLLSKYDSAYLTANNWAKRRTQ